MRPGAQPTTAELVAFIRAHKWGVVASVGPAGAAQAAVVGIAVTDALEIVFDTLGSARKAQNLRNDPRVAIVIGWDEAQTLQLEGLADEPIGPELARIRSVYFTAFADGTSRLAWPGLTHFRVRARWLRYSDFRGAEPAIHEISFAPA